MASAVEMPTTSRAAVVTDFNAPLEIRDLPVPDLEHGALLVKVDVATVCGSDVHLWDGSLNAIRPIELPVVPGHEMVGRVIALGEGDHRSVDGQELAIGDRIVYTQGRCGTCFYCAVSQQANLCENRKHYGTNCARPPYLGGAFTEYSYVYPTSRRIRVPGDVKPEWAAAASCALRTVVGAFERLGAVEPWQTVVIQGAGPLGLFATAVAKRAGAQRIIVIGDPTSRLDVARAWGASDTVSVAEHPAPEDRVEAVRALTGSAGAEIVMEYSGARTAFAEGLAMVRRGGRYVVVGQVGPHEVSIRPTDLTRGDLTVLGCFSASESHYWKAIHFLSRAQDEFDFDRLLAPTRYSLEDAGKALAAMQSMSEIKPVIVPSA
jgi:L-iditol 2-dehydrogenase